MIEDLNSAVSFYILILVCSSLVLTALILATRRLNKQYKERIQRLKQEAEAYEE